MAWEVWWALVLGFAASAIVQASVPRERIEGLMSSSGVLWNDHRLQRGGGRTYYICSDHCLRAFEADPEKHVNGAAPAGHDHAVHAHR